MRLAARDFRLEKMLLLPAEMTRDRKKTEK
jgi:hypothetical protein